MKVFLCYNCAMSEITYNGITAYVSDEVLVGVRRYIELNERPLFAPSPSMGAAYAAPPQSPMQDAAPLRPPQAPMHHAEQHVLASRPSEAAPAPKRRRGIFSGFKISHKMDTAKEKREDSSVCAAHPPAPQEMSVFSDQTAGPVDDILSKAEVTFQTHLLKLIDKKELTDSEVYKKADIDRRLFSKIRSNPDYRPKKQTALALALALELNIDEAVDLLGRAGYAFSPSSRFDLITRYCIEQGIYDLMEVNALLFYYDQPLLGGQM